MTVLESQPRRLRQRILVAIDESGLKQKDIAEQLGVSPQVVSRWVKGHTVPDALDLLRLAQVTGQRWLADSSDLFDLDISDISWNPECAGQSRVLAAAG